MVVELYVAKLDVKETNVVKFVVEEPNIEKCFKIEKKLNLRDKLFYLALY